MKVRIWTLSLCVIACAVAAARGAEQDAKSRLLEAENRALRSQIAALKDMNAAGQKSLAAFNERVATLEKKLVDAHTVLAALHQKNEQMKDQLAKAKAAIAHRANLASKVPAPPAKAPKTVDKDEASIDDYRFVWVVAKAGDVELRVEKTEDTTCIELCKGMDILTMTPANAEAVAAVLARADQYRQAMKGDAEKRETVKAGQYNVTFANSPKHGFSVSVRSAERFSMNSIYMERKDAKALAVHMAKAKRLTALVDKKISPTTR